MENEIRRQSQSLHELSLDQDANIRLEYQRKLTELEAQFDERQKILQSLSNQLLDSTQQNSATFGERELQQQLQHHESKLNTLRKDHDEVRLCIEENMSAFETQEMQFEDMRSQVWSLETHIALLEMNKSVLAPANSAPPHYDQNLVRTERQILTLLRSFTSNPEEGVLLGRLYSMLCEKGKVHVSDFVKTCANADAGGRVIKEFVKMGIICLDSKSQIIALHDD